MKFLLLPQTFVGYGNPFTRFLFVAVRVALSRENREKSLQVLLMSQYRRKSNAQSSFEEFKKKTLTALKSRSEDFSPRISTSIVGRKEIVKPIKYGAKANSQMGTP